MGIRMKDVTMRFKNGVVAVNHVNLEMEHGIYGLLGENGAGKTTLMRVLTTILKPVEGEAFFNDIRYCEKNYEEIQRSVGYLPQELNLYPNLTVRECLEYLGGLSGISKSDCTERIDHYLEKTNLTEHQRKKMKQLSGGMKRRVGLIQALLNNPAFLIVDEPTTGLDPEERIRIRNLLVDVARERVVLFSTHVVEDLAATCNQIAIMKKGKLIYSGSVMGLLEQANGKVWICDVKNKEEVGELEKNHSVSSKQYTKKGMAVKVLSDEKPFTDCRLAEVTLEDAYIYVTNHS